MLLPIKFHKIVKSRIAFYPLLKALQSDLVLDIGSRDGRDSLDIRRALPTASVIAYEAHPLMAKSMQNDTRLSNANISVESCAVSNFNGTSEFEIFAPEKNMGSLRTRNKEGVDKKVSVTTRRIDSFPELSQYKNITLWVDVEGSSYEALEGVGKLLNNVNLIHLEVETQPIWEGQILYGDVDTFLRKHGFSCVRDTIHPERSQGNALYIRNKSYFNIKVQWAIISLNIKHLLALVAYKSNLKKRMPGLFTFLKRVVGK